MPPTKLEHALNAASRGLRAFPQIGKRPSIRNWPQNATTHEAPIRKWWARWPDADIGIALDPDVYVLDADTPAACKALRTWDLPTTLEVATARGFHLYFRVPHELARLVSGNTRMDGVEGKGAPGPVTWAGSVHPSGKIYSLYADAPIADMPAWLVKSIGPKVDRGTTGEATAQERAEYAARARLVSAPLPALYVTEARMDAIADLSHTLHVLRSELPEMQTGWADRLYRAGAYLGPCVASGALGLDETIKELTRLFTELNEQGGDPGHALRSIERGVAQGARESRL